MTEKTERIEPVGSLFVYFREAVAAASTRRKVATEPATADYLANLLVTFGTAAGNSLMHQSIVLTLDEALARPTAGEQLLALQSVGDGALYLVSFFPEYLARSHLDESLYVNLGAYAYGQAAAIARKHGTAEPRVWVDLTTRFGEYADVLGSIAEASALGTVTKNLVQLFDRWKNTGSARALDAMARAGAFPMRGGTRTC